MRSYLLSGACAATMLLALTTAGQAADIDVAPAPQGWEWYVSIFGGWSLPKDEEITLADTAGSTFQGEIELDNGFMVGAALGVQFSEWARVELEVSRHWHDAGGEGLLTTAAASTGEYAIDGEEHALFLLANLWVDLPIDEVVRPYVGGGVGLGRLDVEVEAAGTQATVDFTDDEDWGFAYQLGAGLALDLASNVAVDLGYRYKRINNADIEFALGTLEDEAEKDYISHNLVLGLRFGF